MAAAMAVSANTMSNLSENLPWIIAKDRWCVGLDRKQAQKACASISQPLLSGWHWSQLCASQNSGHFPTCGSHVKQPYLSLSRKSCKSQAATADCVCAYRRRRRRLHWDLLGRTAHSSGASRCATLESIGVLEPAAAARLAVAGRLGSRPPHVIRNVGPEGAVLERLALGAAVRSRVYQLHAVVRPWHCVATDVHDRTSGIVGEATARHGRKRRCTGGPLAALGLEGLYGPTHALCQQNPINHKQRQSPPVNLGQSSAGIDMC